MQPEVQLWYGRSSAKNLAAFKSPIEYLYLEDYMTQAGVIYLLES